MKLKKLTVIGASSPFTIQLIDCLKFEKGLGPFNLMLLGRNSMNLELIYQYANFHLKDIGYSVQRTTDLDLGLRDSSIIVHQNRYGGYEGRLQDEEFASKLGMPPDETLGPSGLQSAIRMAPFLKELALKIQKASPDALLINLTNPLSIAVSLFHFYGVKKVVGVCELPFITAGQIAESLGVKEDELEWHYDGFNHRGFIHSLRIRGEDVFPKFLRRIAISGFNNFSNNSIQSLNGVPLKYFHLLSPSYSGPPRANAVASIAEKALQELADQHFSSPKALNERKMEWYPHAVVPLLKALEAKRPANLVINFVGSNGITYERKCQVSEKGIIPMPSSTPGEQVQNWLQKFEQHEKAVLHAVLEPNHENFSTALASDPIIQCRRN